MNAAEQRELCKAVRQRLALRSGWHAPEFDGAGDGHKAARYRETRYVSSGDRIVSGGRVLPRAGAA